MESFKKMESFKQKAKLSRRFSSRKSMGSLKTRFKKFLSDHNAKGREAEGSLTTGSDSDRDDRETSSPRPQRSGELKRSSGSSSSSSSHEGSPSKLKEHEKSDSSSDSSSSEKKRKKGPQKVSSRKKLQVHLEQEPHEIFRLPPLEETPPTSPQSIPPRFSTGGLSDYGRLWTHASAPNSPANLAHNLHLSYRGGDSSPVALIHCLSTRERGKHASQVAEISLASPPGSGRLDLDALDVKLEEMQASPSKTTPPLKPNGLPIVHHDEEQGVWRCTSCGWIYPNPNPSLRNRREHKRHCGEITNVQRWLGAQDSLDTSEKGSVELEGPSDRWEGSDQQPKLSSADERPMTQSDKEDNHEGESEMSADPDKTVAEGRVDGDESNGSPDHHAVGVAGTNGRNFDASVDPDEVDGELKVNRVLEWPTGDSEIKDHNSSGESLSNGSSRRHEVEDQNTLGDASSSSTGHHGAEEINKLDDSVDEGLEVSNPTRGAAQMMTPEVENEKDEPAAADAKLEQAIDDDESPPVLGSELEDDESGANPKQPEDGEGDVEEQPVNGNERLEESGQHTLAAAHSNGHSEHVEHISDLREEEDDNGNHDSSDNSDRPHDTGLTDVQELCNEPSLVTSDRGIEGGQSIDDSEDLGNQDDSNNQTPSDDGLKEEEAEPAKEVEKMEPRVTADNGKPVHEAQGMQEFQSIDPSPSTANLPKEKEQVDSKIGEIVEHDGVETGHGSNGKALKADAREVTKMDSGVPELTEPSHSQSGRSGTPNDHLGMEKDVKSNGDEFPDHRSEQQVTEIESVEGEGNSTRESPAQRNGIQTGNAEKLTGSPVSLEEPPKWMNSGMVTSQDEVDRFSSVQKYWADVTSSKYLLVEGKRSPSFGGRSDDVGFLSFRNGDGRRSPSPFSLSKSEHGEIQSESALDSINHHIAVVDRDEDRIIPVADIVQHHGSSSSGVHVEYDLEKVVHEQNTHDLFCPVCGSDVTKRIILKKRKRTSVPEDNERLRKVVTIEPAGPQQDQGPVKDDSDDETWGCVACLSFFIHRGSGKRESSVPSSPVSGEPSETEQERVPCLPKLFLWAPRGTSDSDLQEPLLGQTPREEAGEVSEPPPGRIHEVPFDDDEEGSCFSYLRRSKDQSPAAEGSEPAKEEDTTELPEPKPVTAGRVLEVPLDEEVSCFSYLQRHKSQPPAEPAKEEDTTELPEPKPVISGRIHEVPLDDETSCFSYLQRSKSQRPAVDGSVPEAEPAREQSTTELPEPKPVTTGRILEVPLDDQVSCFSYLQRPRSQPPVVDGSLPAEIEHKAPIASDQVEEAGDSSRELPVEEQVSPIPLTEGSEVSSPRPNNASTESEEREKCECLPFFSFTSEKFFSVKAVTDVPASPQGVAELDAGSSSSLPTRESTLTEDPNKEGTSNFLPASVPAFPLGSSSKYDLPPSPGISSPHRVIARGTGGQEESTARSPTASLTQGPRGVEDAEEKTSCNCVPELTPAFSWGRIPVYTHAPLDLDESSRLKGPRDADAGSPTSSLTQEPQAPEDAEDKTSCNCVPELLPAFSWGPIPVYTHDMDESLGLKGPKEAGADIPTSSLTQVPQGREDVEEKRSSNCLADVLPAFSWGTGTIAEDDNTERQLPPSTTGRIHGVPLDDDEVLKDLKGKRVVEEGVSSPSASRADDSEKPEVASHDTSSHVETEAKETATCLCIPLLLPAIHWGVTKRSTQENGLREPLLPEAGPAPLDDTSLVDSKQTAGTLEPRLLPRLKEGLQTPPSEPIPEPIPDPVLLHGLEEGLQAPPSGPGTPAEPVLSSVEQSPSTLDLSKGTEITESEDIHIEGLVSSRKTFTKTEPNEEPADVNVLHSNYHFEVDIEDGHLTSTVEKLEPKPPLSLVEISSSDPDSSTDTSKSCSAANVGSVVHGDVPGVDADASGENLVQHLADAIKGQLGQENGASPGVVSIIRRTFPAEEIPPETESRGEESMLDRDSCNCVPVTLPTVRWWGPSRGFGGSLEEHLLDKAEDKRGAGEANHVNVGSTAVRRESRTDAEDGTGEACNCLPSVSLYHVFRDHHISPEPQPGTEVEDFRTPLVGRSPPKRDSVAEPQLPGTEVDDIRAPLLGRSPPERDVVVNIDQTTETNITVEGATSEEAAAVAIARARNRVASKSETTSEEYLKSIVHGGLDVTLFSLGVVASGAGGDAKTLTVIAIGLANLAFGVVTHLSNVMSLYYNNRTKFQDEVGHGFVHGCLSFLSFLFFGALAPITYGFSFRKATSTYYKMVATCFVALVSIVLLGAANAHVKSKSTVRVISILVVTGILAVIAGYEAGDYAVRLLDYCGFSSL